MSIAPTIVWFRLDLRLQDNPALNAARARGGPVIPVYVLDDAAEGCWVAGAASRWWLHHSLAALGGALRARGSRLILARGDASVVLRNLARATGAGAVCWNDRHEPAAAARDRRMRQHLATAGIAVQTFRDSVLFAPSAVANRSGRPFQVFTPFWRRCRALPVAKPWRLQPGGFAPPARWPRSLALTALELRPRIKWDAGLAAAWTPGEAAARRRLRRFVRRNLDGYAAGRDRPAGDGTSRLSPHLHFGEITPRQVWAALRATAPGAGGRLSGRGAWTFWSEIGWREFACHLLHHFPHTPEAPLRPEFRAFPWERNLAAFRAWQRGRTGYPMVDAGMRELWRTGWMHNRVRMMAASFLVKDLRLPWQAGARWFWDTLVDADLASNTLGWQWSAGCGADAVPYFRVFNPVLQGRKFDADGDYVRRWVPELAKLPTRHLHAPWEAPPAVLAAAGVVLGETYPRPMVDHRIARNIALAAYERLRQRHT
ncbi:MAG TPA: deoxyribodipyrimidine photo-lyase [Opitutaceae bacterium]|nr:deoxyribodipyrimidine photo-lyase [Opitutaceae bacterium]